MKNNLDNRKIALFLSLFAMIFVVIAILTAKVDDMSIGDKNLHNMDENWRIIIGNNVYTGVTIPYDAMEDHYVYQCIFEYDIPTDLWGKTILMYTQNGSFKVYFDNDFTYQYGTTDLKLIGKSTGKAWHLIDIPKQLDNNVMRIEMESVSPDAELSITKVYVGSRSSCIMQIYDTSRIYNTAVYAIVVMFFCIMVLVFFQRKNGIRIDNLVYGVPYIGVTALYYSMQTDTFQMDLGNQYASGIICSVTYMFIPFFMLLVFGKHLKIFGNKLYEIIKYFISVFIFVSICLQIFNIMELYVTRIVAGLLIYLVLIMLLISYIKAFGKYEKKLYDVIMMISIVIYIITMTFSIVLGVKYGSLYTIRYSLVGATLFCMALTAIEMTRFNKELALREKAGHLAKIQHSTIGNLADLIESRDEVTGYHVKNTMSFVEIIVNALMEKGYYKEELNEKVAKDIIEAAPLHDVGKISISDTILLAPRKLTKEEFEIMKTHTIVGGKIVEKILSEFDDEEYKKIAVQIATCHHERWDGKGYPYGKRETEIPLSACIMAVADVYDALISQRPYKKEFSCEEAFNIIESESGTHFSPKVVEVFLSKKDEIIKAARLE